MAIVQVYRDAAIQVSVDDTLSSYILNFPSPFHSIGLNSLAPQQLPENIHLYLNSHRGHYQDFHKTVTTYYKPNLSLTMLTQGKKQKKYNFKIQKKNRKLGS